MAKVITENFRVESSNEFVKSFRTSNDAVVAQFQSGLELYSAELPELNAYDPDNSPEDGPQLTDAQITSITNLAEANINTILPENNYYVMASSIDKENVINNSQKEKREFQRRVLFGNRLSEDNIRYMFEMKQWQSNNVYAQFDDTADMGLTDFYVTVMDGDVNETSYKVFKCISNNGGTASINQPSTANLDINFETALEDGYVWKYMFQVPPSEYLLFATASALPYYPDQTVINNASEGISNIVIQNTNYGIFSDYLIGDRSQTSTTPAVGAITQVAVDSEPDNTWRLTISSANVVKSSRGAYKNMYVYIPSTGELFEILDSTIPTNVSPSQNKLILAYVKTTTNIVSRADLECHIVPKVRVSYPDADPTGEVAVAYGILDWTGTVKSVQFKTKGSGYKYAVAELMMPPAIEDQAAGNELRVIMSPTGGHGSDPVLELYMSKVSVMTNFFTDNITNIPGTGSYTKIGLVKNPKFRDGTFPPDFDNRCKLSFNGNLTAQIQVGYYITQVVGDELVEGIVHEVKYDAANTQTNVWLVDNIGAYNAEFTPFIAEDTEAGIVGFSGEIKVKVTPEAADSQTFVINNIEQNKYTPYSGVVLHFVDFDPITRTASRKEKVKLVFDF